MATCRSGSCQNTAIPLVINAPCRDGDPCTEQGWCWEAKCSHSLKCANDGNPCTIESCDPKSGDCQVALAGDGTACADATDCRGPGSCLAGTCATVKLPDGATCESANPCLTGASCQGGYCSDGKTALVGAACKPPDTFNDICMINGNCQPDGSCKGSGILCPADVACQYRYVCDKDANSCVKIASAPDDPCSDGEPCTTNDHCVAGGCVGDISLPDGYLCDDGGPCSAGDQCRGGHCAGNADPEMAGRVCDFDHGCDQLFTCQQGLCKAAPGPAGESCNDANPCTADSCGPALLAGETTCTHIATSAAQGCAGENPCATGTCSKGVCVAGPDLCATVWTETFDTPSAAAWMQLPAPASDSAGWAIDATPALPGFHSPPFSLNFNNGKNYQLFQWGEETATAGAIVSPPVPVPKGQAVLRFWSWHGVETLLQYDLRWIELSTNGFATPAVVTYVLHNKAAPLQWSQVVVPLTALAGKTVQIRFRFDSRDGLLNDGPGWFVDDLEFAVVGP